MHLSSSQIESFIAQGFLRLDEAFPPALAAACRAILWRDMGCDPHDSATWQRPVIWLGVYAQAPFVEAANTPKLRAAFDQLVGAGSWEPRRSLGTFPIRFPTTEDTRDTGWHVDASFPGADSDLNNYLTWHVNVHSKERALLMLFLFSSVGKNDAPTRIRVGSHLKIARLLASAGEKGLPVTALDYNQTADCPEMLALGEAGTVYLCHPFLVHAAQINRGNAPRFLAQPPLRSVAPFQLDREDARDDAPVESAIRLALQDSFTR